MASDDEMDMSYVSEVMKTMYNFSLNKQFTDFRIRAGEKTVHVHQSVICAKSDFFRAICQSGNSEASMKNASGEDGEILSAVRRFMYFGKTTITAQNVESLALAADFIKNHELKEKCETIMMNSLTLEKLQPYSSLAQRIDLPRLQAECLRFSKDHFSEVSNSSWFLSLALEEVHSYLQDDELNAPKEYQVIQAVLRWLENSRATPAGKEAFVEQLFPCLHLPFCNRSELQTLCKDPKVAKSLKLGVFEYLNYGMHSDHQPRRFTELSAEGSLARTAVAKPKVLPSSAATAEPSTAATAEASTAATAEASTAATAEPSTAATRTRTSAATSTPNSIYQNLPPPLPPRATPGTSSVPHAGENTEDRILLVGGFQTGRVIHDDIICLEKHDLDPITQVPSNHVSLCAMDDALLVSGGHDFDTGTSTSLVHKFCFSSRSWISLSDTLEPVSLHGSACVNKQLYTMGGCYTENRQIKKRYAAMNVLDLTSGGKWSKCSPMPLATNQPGIAVVDAFIFAFGGNTDKEWSVDVHKFNTTNGRWARCQRMPKSGNVYSSTAVVNRQVYVFAGHFFLSYNVDMDAWTELSLPMRPSYCCSMVLHRGCLVVTGGVEDRMKTDVPNDRVQVYDIAQRMWRMEKYTMPLPLRSHWVSLDSRCKNMRTLMH